jgi:REP element-mobilizing transposase RayT
MSALQPIYSPDNISVAYQLNWSLTLSMRERFIIPKTAFETLKTATEIDAVRILEHRQLADQRLQFLISSQPQVSPSDIVRSVKGRLQHVITKINPKAFQRSYNIYSIGETNNDCLNAYVAKQPARHPMADPRVQRQIELLQFYDERINLKEPQFCNHGRFLHNLHIVIENRDHLHIVNEEYLHKLRSMIIRSCAQKHQLLARIGLVSNHMHLLLGCDVACSPQSIALSLMNNLAYSIGMKAIFEFSYYVGTFGPYDRDAIRRGLPSLVQSRGFSEKKARS